MVEQPGGNGEAGSAYATMIAATREAILRVIEPGEIAVVFSRGEPALVEVPGLTLWHFPRLPNGNHAGFYPRDDAQAVLHLRHLLLVGASVVVVPASVLWWVDSYPGLFAEIDRHFRLVHDDLGSCRVYRLREIRGGSPGPPSQGSTETLLASLTDATARADLRDLFAYLLTFDGLGEPGQQSFALWEQLGWHIVPADFHSPIPHVRDADRANAWAAQHSLAGVEMRTDRQLALLIRLGAVAAAPEHRPFWDAVQAIASDPDNVMFRGIDAVVYGALLLESRPRRIVEVGSGHSTRLALAYQEHVDQGNEVGIVCIDPAPPRFLERLASDLVTIRREPVQQVEPDLFRSLGPGDILFFDGSHVARMGSDVHYLYFNVLPTLAPGVLVHVHDVFLPGEYPRHLIVPGRRFWNEQYLLYAFLQYNSAFEVVIANAFLHARHQGALSAAFGGAEEAAGGSFWLRRR